jgi:hypothetical protein
VGQAVIGPGQANTGPLSDRLTGQNRPLSGRRAQPPQIILELYRCRWQVELAFKRLKSLMQFGHLPKKDPRTARAWMQMKLLIALLIERMLFDAKFVFPWGYDWCKIEPVEGVSGNV